MDVVRRMHIHIVRLKCIWMATHRNTVENFHSNRYGLLRGIRMALRWRHQFLLYAIIYFAVGNSLFIFVVH